MIAYLRGNQAKRLEASVVGKRSPPLVLLVVGWLLAGCSDAGKSRLAEAASNTDTPEVLLAHGRQQSRLCLGCHGPRGVSQVVSYPSIAGKSKEQLAYELVAFRNGERVNPLMNSVAKSLSDRDIQALSLYYSQQKLPLSVQDHAL